MNTVNPFLLDKNMYVRDINPIAQYVEQAAMYLSISTGKPIEETKAFVKKQMNRKDIGIVDPPLLYLERQPNGDRERKETTLISYLRESINKKELIAPTFTTYVPPSVKESLMVRYIDNNVKNRGISKKAAQAAEAAKQYDLASYKNNEQKNKKLKNNAVSGGMVSASTPLHNPTGHSTLTSVCRSTSAYGSANNEKFVSGNRHYFSSDTVINNIVSILKNTDYAKFEVVVDKYNLAQLTVEDVMSCIYYSSKLYWNQTSKDNAILDLVNKLTPLQRQVFVYTGDFHHLRIHNDLFVRNFLKELSVKIEGSFPGAIEVIHNFPEDNLNLAHQICSTEMKGKGKKYIEMVGTPGLETLALTTKNIGEVLHKYLDFIQVMWVSDNVPSSIANFPESIRRTVLTSDTDSTIFTVQEWVVWYQGGIHFDSEATAIGASVIFLASQTITHLLAKMSANLGIKDKRLFQIAMKNEFKFDVYVPTRVAKHYFATISCQEGNVFEKMKNEIKGVHLITSNAPPKIIQKAHKLIDDIVKTVMAGDKLRITEILKGVADTEREIIRSITSSETEYFRLGQIKSPSSYKAEEASAAYQHHLFWRDVFAPKYGDIAPPPYGCIKIATTLESAADIVKWLDSIEDKLLAGRAREWLQNNRKKALPNIMLSTDVIDMGGIPPELARVIDVRSIVSDLSGIYYMILETLGVYMKNKKRTKLAYDYY